MGKKRTIAAKPTERERPKTGIGTRIVIALVLALITIAAYSPVFTAKFVTKYDDAEYVTNNKHVQAGLSGPNVAWAFTTKTASNWHPITWISHMTDISLFGINRPAAHHAMNLLFHLASVVLLFFALGRMTGSVWRSAFVAALFAIHPMHVESVAWVAERKDVLSTFFMMLALLAYTWHAARPGIGRYLLVFFAFALGLMSKPMLVTLPFLLLLLDFWPLGRFAKGKASSLLLEKMPMLALSIASSALTCWAQRGAMGLTDSIQFGYRLANALISYIEYIGKMLWPVNMATFYPHPGIGVSIPLAILSGIVLAGATVLTIAASKRRPWVGVGWLWYVITLIPVIGLLQVGGQAMADRYTYIPYIGLFVIVAWTVPELFSSRTKLLAVPAAILLIALSVLTNIQAGYWHNDETLFAHGIQVTRDNWFCYNNLGNVLLDEGKIDDAIENYKLALQCRPNYALASSNLGNALAEKGDPAAGLSYALDAVKLDPNNADAENNAGRCLGGLARFAEAIPYFDRALEVAPDMAEARYNRGLALYHLKRWSEAIPEFRRVLDLNPEYRSAYPYLALSLANVGDRQGAEAVITDAGSHGVTIPPEIVRVITGK